MFLLLFLFLARLTMSLLIGSSLRLSCTLVMAADQQHLCFPHSSGRLSIPAGLRLAQAYWELPRGAPQSNGEYGVCAEQTKTSGRPRFSSGYASMLAGV